MKKMNRYGLWITFIGCVVFSMQACSPVQKKGAQNNRAMQQADLPRVLSIGSSSTLVFKKSRALEIPIDVRVNTKLDTDNDNVTRIRQPVHSQAESVTNKHTVHRVTQIAVTVTGIVPLKRGTDYWIEGQSIFGAPENESGEVNKLATGLLITTEQASNGNLFDYLPATEYYDPHHPIYLVVNSSYTSEMETNDRLEVRVDYSTYEIHVPDELNKKEIDDKADSDPEPTAEEELAEALAQFLSQIIVNGGPTGFEECSEYVELGREEYGNTIDPNPQEEISTAQNSELTPETKRIVPRVLARRGTVTRTFSCFKAEDYRERTLKDLLPLGNIAAFPLPNEEVHALFGEKVADRFFVVRLAIRNESETPILVSTGMIEASGRAIVRPKDGITTDFSIPVTVTPQSWEAVYAVMERDEVKSGRSQFFRGLKFVGAVATAWANAASWGADAIQGLGVYTGVFIPEPERFGPDPFDGYKRNLVNFSMQEHSKVPANSVSKSRFLFFSKDSVDALVPDSNLHNRNADPGFFANLNPFQDALKADYDKIATADSTVIYLEIGNLSVPFDGLSEDARLAYEREVEKRNRITNSLAGFFGTLGTMKEWKGEAKGMVDAISKDDQPTGVDIFMLAQGQFVKGQEEIAKVEILYQNSSGLNAESAVNSRLSQVREYKVLGELYFERAKSIATFVRKAPSGLDGIAEDKQEAYQQWRAVFATQLSQTGSIEALKELLDGVPEKLEEFKGEPVPEHQPASWVV